MAHSAARLLLLCLVLGVGLGLVTGAPPDPAARAAGLRAADPRQPGASRVVFLGTGLSIEDTIVFTAAVAAADHPGVVLLDNPRSTPYTRAFVEAFAAAEVIPVGAVPDDTSELEQRLGRPVARPLTWQRGRPAALWRALFPQSPSAVICPAGSPRLLLQSAFLAGVVKAPLFILRGEASEQADLRNWLMEWRAREVFTVGDAADAFHLPDVRQVRLAGEAEVAALAQERLARRGPVEALVVANPADGDRNLGSMSVLAPWVALRRRAPLLLTNDAGTDGAAVVKKALRRREFRRADTLVLVAGLDAVPMEQRGNPAPGKDDYIEMEPLTPTGADPYSFATGRLFHEEPSMVLLQLARARLLDNAGPRRALVVSNAGNGLPLLEAFSRNTARELHNAGYATTTLFGDAVNKDDVRRLLPEHDVFLWEGHHNTLMKDYGFKEWTEPLPPSLLFLQSCLALTESKALPPLHRGAIGVVGSSTRTYSASGGAFTLAFFNALQYEGQSLGGALRHAKNFLLAYSLLKEKRLGSTAKLAGANQRTAWAFTLWGDPGVMLPRPEPAAGTLPPVRHLVSGDTIVVTLPAATYEPVATSKYVTQMQPNARLAGLLQRGADDGGKARLVPFVFAEVHLPDAPPGQTPRLRSRLPSRDWVFLWDRRRRCGYLLAVPRPRGNELRFEVAWDQVEVAEADLDDDPAVFATN